MKTGMIIVFAGTIALAGCAPVGGPGVSSYYDCGDGIRLKVDSLSGDRVMVQMNNDKPVTLPADKSASGAKYMSATHQFWSKGDEATWTVGRMVPMTCRKVAVPRGV
ncbi:membrane-bound inhibitor of C-type lysozyme [Porphyrobacter sp. MBR-155]|uniref:MliC family protein n=1 Tax=Porphyrobacter sp. MBR-155 TaxID=3156464 RepID=UPI003393C04A